MNEFSRFVSCTGYTRNMTSVIIQGQPQHSVVTQGNSMKSIKIALLVCTLGACFSVTAQTYNRIGNTTISSDGTSYNRVGNTTIGSDGTSYNRIGNTTVTNDGRSYNQIGNTTIGSDGTVANRIGNTTIINSPNGSRTCNQIGTTTVCN